MIKKTAVRINNVFSLRTKHTTIHNNWIAQYCNRKCEAKSNHHPYRLKKPAMVKMADNENNKIGNVISKRAPVLIKNRTQCVSLSHESTVFLGQNAHWYGIR